MPAPALMIQGTGSGVGKSLMVAGLCRAFARRGMKVFPFTPQSVTNDTALTMDGGEIASAQWMQARACGVTPSVHMNPVLLRPQADGVISLVVQGKLLRQMPARDYHHRKGELLEVVQNSFRLLGDYCDLVIAEGSGSPAEAGHGADIANMGFARPLGVPVVMVADFERGGAMAGLMGTKEALSEQERACVRGFILNKFRGDEEQLVETARMTIERTSWPHLGTLPFMPGIGLFPRIDAFCPRAHADAPARIAVIRLPHMIHAEDFEPLRAEPEVELQFIAPGEPLPGNADLIIIPGSSDVFGDLQFLRDQSWDIDLAAHARRGGRVLGLGAGYAMLGVAIDDPKGGAIGLSMLEVNTRLEPPGPLEAWRGTATLTGLPVQGSRMAIGATSGVDTGRPLFDPQEGAQSSDGRIQGCYLHGIFASDAWRQAYLSILRAPQIPGVYYYATVEADLKRLADQVEASLNLDALLAMAS